MTCGLSTFVDFTSSKCRLEAVSRGSTSEIDCIYSILDIGSGSNSLLSEALVSWLGTRVSPLPRAIV